MTGNSVKCIKTSVSGIVDLASESVMRTKMWSIAVVTDLFSPFYNNDVMVYRQLSKV